MESAYYNDLSQEMFTGLANLAASDMAQYVLISEYVKIARVLRRHCFLVIHYITYAKHSHRKKLYDESLNLRNTNTSVK